VDDEQPPPQRPTSPALRHAPLRRWSPYTAQEYREVRGFLSVFTSFPYLTVGTIAVLVCIYAVQLALGWPMSWLLPSTENLVDELFVLRLGESLGWLSAPAVLDNGEYWRLVSSTLLHGSNLHVAGNCAVLYMFGRNVENGIGRAAYLVTFVGAGALGAAMSTVLLGHESLGASGAVLGMLGASLAFGRRYRQRLPHPLRDYFGIDMWMVVLLVTLLSLLPMVDWAGHLGGFLWGLVVGASWPARMYSEASDGEGRALRLALAVAAIGCVAATMGVMGQRTMEIQAFLPDNELRALRYAVESDEVEQQLAIAERLAEAYPASPKVQMIRASVLVTAGRWDEAADQLRIVEQEWPMVVDAEPYFDNDLAWSLFMGRPDDPEAISEGLERVRRNLGRDRENHAMQNTLAYGLYLDGQFRQADRALSEAMTGASPEERGSDVFLDVLIQLALERPQEALDRYGEAVAQHPDGEFRGKAEAKLAELKMLDPKPDNGL